MQIELSDLDGWVGSTGMEEKVNWRRPDGGPLYSFSYTPGDDLAAEFKRGVVRLRNVTEIGGTKPGIKVWPTISVEYAKPHKFDQILRDGSRIEKLVTLCIDAPSVINKLVVTHDGIRENSLAGTDIGRRMIEYRASLIGYIEPAERVVRHPFQMLLSFDELGGIASVARWLDATDEFESALDAMMSITHSKQMFGENRFLNVTYAAEAFHRVTAGDGRTYLPDAEYATLVEQLLESAPEGHREWIRDKLAHANQPPLGKRLRELARDAGSAAKPLIGNRDDWAYAITQVRNTLTHLGDGIKVDGGGLRHLTESVYAVARICILRRIGVAASVLEVKADAENLTWYRKALHETIADVRKQAQARDANRRA